ncbi:hypothetical protein [Paenibacillus sp. FSL R7-0331]|uniref:hypothetical protein n=1 Tax=Paenibacillus sp. FSL R7-0331 TaxID=1536773 RepID=UPI0004F88F08|nr:hypothetical protein [Paenibacillus sp. FSL R7-0331]AIQ53451.1 hypothetical protein R70331_19245 [Paenibacillus sp. FSL R7-0331]
MTGQVYIEYRRLSYYAVECENKEFSVLVVHRGLLSLKDKLTGELDLPGEKQVYNETTKEELHVSVLTIHFTRAEAKRYIVDAVKGR